MSATLNLMIINEQKAAWPEEYLQLKENKEVNSTSDLAQLSPFLKDNIIRMRPRLEYSNILPEQTRFPGFPVLYWGLWGTRPSGLATISSGDLR